MTWRLIWTRYRYTVLKSRTCHVCLQYCRRPVCIWHRRTLDLGSRGRLVALHYTASTNPAPSDARTTRAGSPAASLRHSFATCLYTLAFRICDAGVLGDFIFDAAMLTMLIFFCSARAARVSARDGFG
jgi:hypothetical protein